MKRSAQLVLALDVDTEAKAKEFVAALYPDVKIFKVGLQLFTLYGPSIVEFVNTKGAEVFLDLKFHDIPNTVAHAVRSAVRLKVKMLTLHISGGEEMLKAAVAAASDEAKSLKIQKPLLIGVTVLTSQQASSDDVLRLARLGLSCGLDGVVCSAKETSLLREKLGKELYIVTPGIRANTAQADDQKRVATAQDAIAAGSDFLVVGRPILQADDPVKAVKDFL